jgi:RES domain-containing protein
MLLYRLANKQYIRDLSGEGARLYGGRWNEKGTAMLYTSEHCSLALLEIIVHTPHNLLPDEISLLKLSVSDELTITTINEQDLPANWRQYPSPDSLAEIGTKWAHENKTVGLRVPSVPVPDEWNILLNPASQNFDKISIQSVQAFRIDSRF